MYGLVNKGLQDFVVKVFGDSTWSDVCRQIGWNGRDFEVMESYPDSVTYDIIGALAGKTGVEASDLLRRFGSFWASFVVAEGFGDIMSLLGSDLRTALGNLNLMHSRLGMMMANLAPPRFHSESRADGSIVVAYHSKRPGLAPMVHGLLEGMVGHYSGSASVHYLGRDEAAGSERFEVRST